MLHCLNCGREFPTKLQGEVEIGGVMLCLQCGHLMTWTGDLSNPQLREMTDDELNAAGSNFQLMQRVMRIGPRRGIIHRGSWAMTLLLAIILIMVVLERLNVGIHHAH